MLYTVIGNNKNPENILNKSKLLEFFKFTIKI